MKEYRGWTIEAEEGVQLGYMLPARGHSLTRVGKGRNYMGPEERQNPSHDPYYFADLEGTTPVTVRPPCTCGAKQWFMCKPYCPARDTVASYDVVTYDTVPNDEQLNWIRNEHPGMELVYIDPTRRNTSLTLLRLQQLESKGECNHCQSPITSAHRRLYKSVCDNCDTAFCSPYPHNLCRPCERRIRQ